MRTVGMVRTIVGLLLFSLVGVAMAQEGNVRRYPLPNHGTIQLQAPASWKDELRQPPNALPPTIAYKPQSGAPFEVLLTPIWPASKNASPAGPDALRKMVQNAADQAKSQAVEKMIALKELKGTSGLGYYFSATDRAPAPGEYKHLTQGIMRVGELIVTFTILTNDAQEKIVADAIATLMSARHVGN